MGAALSLPFKQFHHYVLISSRCVCLEETDYNLTGLPIVVLCLRWHTVKEMPGSEFCKGTDPQYCSFVCCPRWYLYAKSEYEWIAVSFKPVIPQFTDGTGTAVPHNTLYKGYCTTGCKCESISANQLMIWYLKAHVHAMLPKLLKWQLGNLRKQLLWFNSVIAILCRYDFSLVHRNFNLVSIQTPLET